MTLIGSSLLLMLAAFLMAETLEASPTARDAAIDPLTTRWTFGAHEPYTMYRRIGKKSTGGIEGSAQWLKSWLDWWDAEAPARMEEIGFNGLHSRFYKGMGWEVEKNDFPNVKKFVDNCHKHGVIALAYVQFATLYYEVMQKEIPDIESWAAVDDRGDKYMYSTSYFRWIPCINNEAWIRYMEKILTIALTEGGFDGIMFDNCFAYACYCPRCEAAFRKHIQSLPDCEERFGFAADSMSGVRLPRFFRCEGCSKPPPSDVKDPLLQEWYRWRVKVTSDVVKRFYRHIKSVNPDAIVSANSGSFRGTYRYQFNSVSVIDMADGGLDFLMMQTGNFPSIGPSGEIINRVRDLKLAQAIHKPICALCDGDAGAHEIDETMYLRPLVEDLVWGGVPTDRTVMAPVRRPGFIDEDRFAQRKRILNRFNTFARENRDVLEALSYQPVRVFYPVEPLGLSPSMNESLNAVDEVLLRRHVPFGYLVAKDAAAPAIPGDCEVVVLPDSKWISDAQVASLRDFAKGGGKLVVTGASALWDERGCQRFENPLESLIGLPNVSWRTKADKPLTNVVSWTTRILPPTDRGAALLADLKKVGYAPPVAFVNLPETVFVEVKRIAGGYAVHLVNYDPKVPVTGAKLVFSGKATFREPFGADPSERSIRSDGALPVFSQYATITVDKANK